MRGRVGLLRRGCFSRAAPRGVVAAQRGEDSLAGCSGGCFFRYTPRGVWWLRGGAKFRWRVAAEGAFSAIRRAGCCVVAGPAGRCGRFSCFAHAPLIKKSGQKRNQGLLWPALPSGWSVSGTRASAALRAVSVGDRGKSFLLAAWERLWGWILGVGFVEAVLCGGVLSVCCPEGRPRVP